MLKVVSVAAAFSKAAADVTLATFDGGDGAESTHLKWETVNDPVMGGRSESYFREENGLGLWNGEVKVVWTGSPGFCTLRSPPRDQENEAQFPVLTDTVGVEVTLREAMQPSENPLYNFGLRFRTSTMESQESSYNADFEVPKDMKMKTFFVPWEDFICTWRGEKDNSKCVEGGLQSELGAINSMGLGTHYPGDKGKFFIEIQSFVAKSTGPTVKNKGESSKTDGLADALKTTRTLAMKILV